VIQESLRVGVCQRNSQVFSRLLANQATHLLSVWVDHHARERPASIATTVAIALFPVCPNS
jgi:hypothetical protein